ncbi:MAG: CsbD family protein [Myxococcota bacterium]
MNKEIFEGKWEELKGTMKKTWGKLTDNDLTQIEGNQQEIYGKLEQHYGYTKDQASKAIKDFQDAYKATRY